MCTSPSSWLFPISQYETAFSSMRSDVGNGNIHQVSLSDSGLGVHKSSSHLPHKLVKPPIHGDQPPHVAWEAFFPEGSINPSATIPGGFGFYLRLDLDNLETVAKSV